MPLCICVLIRDNHYTTIVLFPIKQRKTPVNMELQKCANKHPTRHKAAHVFVDETWNTCAYRLTCTTQLLMLPYCAKNKKTDENTTVFYLFAMLSNNTTARIKTKIKRYT